MLLNDRRYTWRMLRKSALFTYARKASRVDPIVALRCE